MHYVKCHGANIPALGLGTFELTNDTARRMVEYALAIGYRHIDTAQMYGNEAEIGEILGATAIPRKDLFVTTKIWPNRFAYGELQRAAEESLSKLQLDRIDLLLLHWPKSATPLEEALRGLNDVKKAGITQHIGISNFNPRLIAQATELSTAPLVLNQVEYHPYLDQSKVLQALRAKSMALTAYSPLAKGKVFKDATLQAIAKKYDKNPGQIALRWLVQQQQVIAIPRTSSETNAKANLEIFDFSLSDDEMSRISALAQPDGRLIDSSLADWD